MKKTIAGLIGILTIASCDLSKKNIRNMSQELCEKRKLREAFSEGWDDTRFDMIYRECEDYCSSYQRIQEGSIEKFRYDMEDGNKALVAVYLDAYLRTNGVSGFDVEKLINTTSSIDSTKTYVCTESVVHKKDLERIKIKQKN